MAPPVVLRIAARRDIDEAVAYYLSEAGEGPALRFIDAMEKTVSRIGHHPTSGSPRYAVELNLPGLRVMPVPRYPHLVFYIDHGNHIDIWRVLHGERDIPAWLRTPEQP